MRPAVGTGSLHRHSRHPDPHQIPCHGAVLLALVGWASGPQAGDQARASRAAARPQLRPLLLGLLRCPSFEDASSHFVTVGPRWDLPQEPCDGHGGPARRPDGLHLDPVCVPRRPRAGDLQGDDQNSRHRPKGRWSEPSRLSLSVCSESLARLDCEQQHDSTALHSWVARRRLGLHFARCCYFYYPFGPCHRRLAPEVRPAQPDRRPHADLCRAGLPKAARLPTGRSSSQHLGEFFLSSGFSPGVVDPSPSWPLCLAPSPFCHPMGSPSGPCFGGIMASWPVEKPATHCDNGTV